MSSYTSTCFLLLVASVLTAKVACASPPSARLFSEQWRDSDFGPKGVGLRNRLSSANDRNNVAVDISGILDRKGSASPSQPRSRSPTERDPSRKQSFLKTEPYSEPPFGSASSDVGPHAPTPRLNPSNPTLEPSPRQSAAEAPRSPWYGSQREPRSRRPSGIITGAPNPGGDSPYPVSGATISPDSRKRLASTEPPAREPPAKRQSKWREEENNLVIKLRGDGMKWDDVAKHLPGRTSISCRLHYQNFLEKRPEWDEEKKNKLSRLYERFRREMWEKVAKELNMPWRAAEDMHWQLGKHELAQRAGVTPFQAAGETGSTSSAGSSSHIPTGYGAGGGGGSGSTTLTSTGYPPPHQPILPRGPSKSTPPHLYQPLPHDFYQHPQYQRLEPAPHPPLAPQQHGQQPRIQEPEGRPPQPHPHPYPHLLHPQTYSPPSFPRASRSFSGTSSPGRYRHQRYRSTEAERTSPRRSPARSSPGPGLGVGSGRAAGFEHRTASASMPPMETHTPPPPLRPIRDREFFTGGGEGGQTMQRLPPVSLLTEGPRPQGPQHPPHMQQRQPQPQTQGQGQSVSSERTPGPPPAGGAGPTGGYPPMSHAQSLPPIQGRRLSEISEHGGGGGGGGGEGHGQPPATRS
ncbi:MAG: hypothetical protein M1831_006945 [Alyxoria varia]|nr:MAG: hypothetical protein M1831_006945 [Alyxoria varia]